MTTDHICPCELILKIGCNEYDEISTAIASLLRSCSITNQQFVSVERQIQPTTYFGSFTTHSLTSKIPIQCQSLSYALIQEYNILSYSRTRFDKTRLISVLCGQILADTKFSLESCR
ncbi:unnamed protein product [Rotaria sp. Silwood2]|nr:unnamed protein product [Rotaria sp. Silwood2]